MIVRIAQADIEALDRIAGRLDETRSDVVRRAIHRYFEETEEELQAS